MDPLLAFLLHWRRGLTRLRECGEWVYCLLARELCACFFMVIRVKKRAVIVVADDAVDSATVVALTSVARIRYRPCPWGQGRRTTTKKNTQNRCMHTYTYIYVYIYT